MSEQESDEELDDLSWNPELQQLCADDSWAIANVEIDEDSDDIAWKNTLAIKMLDYPEILLDLYQKNELDAKIDSKYPKKSILSRSEMERYVRLGNNFRNIQSISELAKKNYKSFKDWKSLQSKVLIEQDEYQRFLMGMSSTFIQKYNHVDPAAKTWFENQMKIAANRIRNYKQLYVHLKDFGIVFVPFKNDSTPCPIGNLAIHLGKKRPLVHVSQKTKIPDSLNDITCRPSSNRPTQCWKKCVVSEDINAERLAIAWNADIVIGMSALQALADNLPPYQAEWEIPVIVRILGDIAYSEKHKIAFIDKPFPPRRIAPRETNQLYFKEMFKQLSCAKNSALECTNSRKKSRRLAKDTSSVEIINQLDGANDEVCGNHWRNHTPQFGVLNQKTLQTCPFLHRADLVSASTHLRMPSDSIMQVDGANDDSLDGAKKQAQDEKSIEIKNDRKSKDVAPSNKSAWMNPRKPELRSLRTPFSDSANVEPFSLKKSTKSWAKTQESTDDSSKHTSEIAATKCSQSSSAADTSAELSFRILPESALSLPANESKNKSRSSKKATESAEDNMSFTPRRSTRKTATRRNSNALNISLDSLIKPKGKKTASNAKLRKIGHRDVAVRSQDSSGSDEEPLIMIQKKTEQKVRSDEVEDGDQNQQCSNVHKDEAHCSKTITRSNKILESDVLGQILGAEPRVVLTLSDVSSTWASQAKKMEKTDIDNSFSANDLALLEPDMNENVSYSLWKFGKKRVLVRYTLDGCLAPLIIPKAERKLVDSNGQKQTYVSLRTKLEYQSDYVFEMLTQSEICRDYITMLFKRPSKIVRACIEPVNKEVLDVEWTSSMHHFQDKAKKVGYNPAVTTKLLTKLFEMVGDLEKGDYVFAHREKEQKISVRKSVDVAGKNVVYDLHKEYCNPGRSVVYTNVVPWVPGDPHKLRTLKPGWPIVPLMFDPDDTNLKGARKSQKM